MSLGELQAEILGVLQKLGTASARDIINEMQPNKHLAYTTVSTVLNRLYRKGLVKRSKVVGRGGVKYVYSYATPTSKRARLVQRALGGLVNAFGPSVIPTIYDSLEQISKQELVELRAKTARRSLRK